MPRCDRSKCPNRAAPLINPGVVVGVAVTSDRLGSGPEVPIRQHPVLGGSNCRGGWPQRFRRTPPGPRGPCSTRPSHFQASPKPPSFRIWFRRNAQPLSRAARKRPVPPVAPATTIFLSPVREPVSCGFDRPFGFGQRAAVDPRIAEANAPAAAAGPRSLKKFRRSTFGSVTVPAPILSLSESRTTAPGVSLPHRRQFAGKPGAGVGKPPLRKTTPESPRPHSVWLMPTRHKIVATHTSPWQKSSRHSTVPASRRTALRFGHILPVCTRIASCPAAQERRCSRDFHHGLIQVSASGSLRCVDPRAASSRSPAAGIPPGWRER